MKDGTARGAKRLEQLDRTRGGRCQLPSFSVARSRAFLAPLVTVEVHLASGLPGIQLVGLPEAEVRAARDRVRAAIQNVRYEFPAGNATVNLAPADLPKESGRFDRSIALGILAAIAAAGRHSLLIM